MKKNAILFNQHFICHFLLKWLRPKKNCKNKLTFIACGGCHDIFLNNSSPKLDGITKSKRDHSDKNWLSYKYCKVINI